MKQLLPFAEVLLGAGLLVGCTSEPKIEDDFAQSMSSPDIQEQIISTLPFNDKQNYKLDAEVFLVYPKGLAEKWIVE